jgi:hypothetical protein
VAGLTSFLQLGSRYVDEYLETNTDIEGYLSPERRPDIITMRKILLAEGTAFQLGRLYPGIIKVNNRRADIAIRRSAIKNIYPSAYKIKNNRDYYDFKLFSDAVAHTGRAFSAAIYNTGIKDELKKNKNIFIPAYDKGAEFPEDKENIVLLKMDKA